MDEQGSSAVETVRSFVNTFDVEKQMDELATPEALARWLQDAGLLGDGGTTASPAEVELATRLREGLREALLAHHEGPAGPPPPPELAEVATQLPVAVDFTHDPPTFRPVDSGVRGALEGLLALVAVTVAEGTWDRLKVCAADDCRWAFFDTSKNRSRTWCAMGVCGNRHKTRAYRARRREHADSV